MLVYSMAKLFWVFKTNIFQIQYFNLCPMNNIDLLNDY